MKARAYIAAVMFAGTSFFASLVFGQNYEFADTDIDLADVEALGHL